MKTNGTYAVIVAVLMLSLNVAAIAQASITSMADYKKKQDDGVAEMIRSSQARAQTGKLTMGTSSAKGKRSPTGPAVIRSAVHPRQTGIDNRRGANMR